MSTNKSQYTESEFKPLFRDSQEAFLNAIKNGSLSDRRGQVTYAGDWMYMHTEPDGADAFKHIQCRSYIYSKNTPIK